MVATWSYRQQDLEEKDQRISSTQGCLKNSPGYTGSVNKNIPKKYIYISRAYHFFPASLNGKQAENIVSVGLDSGYTVKYSPTPEGVPDSTK